jgi:hypothetical protein
VVQGRSRREYGGDLGETLVNEEEMASDRILYFYCVHRGRSYKVTYMRRNSPKSGNPDIRARE